VKDVAFGIGTNSQHTEHTIPKGQFQDVAVKCWFTSKGESRPLMMKLQTDQGEIIPVEHIQLLTSEKQYYAGILTWKYKCKAVANGRELEFVLLFTPESCSWKMVL